MPITIGLINELHFISKSLKTPLITNLSAPLMKHSLQLVIRNDILEVNYLHFLIWKEKIGVPASMFGIESVSEISKIIWLIDNHNLDWRNRVYIENEEILKK